MNKEKKRIINNYIYGNRDTPGLIELVSKRFPEDTHGEVKFWCHLVKSGLEDEDINFIRSGTLYRISELLDFDYSVLKNCYITILKKIWKIKKGERLC